MWHETLGDMSLGRFLPLSSGWICSGGCGWPKESLGRILWGEEQGRKRYFEGLKSFARQP